MRDDFGHRLRRILDEQNTGVIALAEYSRVSANSIWAYIRGEVSPTLKALRKMKDVLGCTWEELLGE